MSSIQQRLSSLLEAVVPSESFLHEAYAEVLKQLEKGLLMHKSDATRWRQEESDFMMLDCNLATLPKGSERGTFYAIDFGGSNIRVVKAVLDGEGTVQIKQKCENIREEGVSAETPKGVLDRKATAKMLFDVIATKVKEYMIAEGDMEREGLFGGRTERLPLGFTFSFGITQPAIDQAILNQWSKEFETGDESDDPVIGRDVCHLMNEGLARMGVPARLNCMLNDTTGTMIAAAMEKPRKLPPCLVGLIVGTGLNACYVERDADMYGYNGSVINVEVGGFRQKLPSCTVDAVVDYESGNKGHQLCEKQVSAFYVAEACRNAIVQIFRKAAPEKAWEPYALPAADLAAIYAQPDDVIDVAREVMAKRLEWTPSTEELIVVKRLVDGLFRRSALLVATIVAALCKKTNRLQRALGGVTVGVDGSMFTKNPKYRDQVSLGLKMVLGKEVASLIQFQITSDGSGKGAACLAATIACRD